MKPTSTNTKHSKTNGTSKRATTGAASPAPETATKPRSDLVKAIEEMIAEGWTVRPPAPQPRAQTEEGRAATAKRDADREAATMMVKAAVEAYNAARDVSNVAISEVQETFHTQQGELLKAIGLLGVAMHPDGADEEAIEEASKVLVCVRETLRICVGDVLVAAGVFTSEGAVAS